MHHKKQVLFYEKGDKKKENTQGNRVVVKGSYIEKMALKESKGGVLEVHRSYGAFYI